MSFAVYYFQGGIRVASGDAAVAALTERVQSALVTGEARGIVVNAANSSAPIVGAWNDAQFFGDMSRAWLAMDVNAVARDTLAGVAGMLAGLYALPSGPANALVADMIASEAFKNSYDKVTAGSQWFSEWLRDFIADGVYLPNIDEIDYDINGNVNSGFNAARNFVPRRDPLVLDLDGDGLELAAASGSVLFDHNADGTKTGTGWARPDDGFLVRDLNGNGTIDSGRELFGVDTIKKSDNTLATQGFDALSDLDSNADGFITSADAAFGELKVWRDLNQDGISQSGELQTLADLNITSIGLIANKQCALY